VVASSIGDEGGDDQKAIASANIKVERPGSDRYQENHMALIFEQGLSFSGFERNKTFIGQDGMRYQDLSDVCGADTDADSRASVVADFDDDGDPDLFVNAIQREQHMLFRNDAGVPGPNNFLKVKLRAVGGHPDAIGAIVKVGRGRRVQAQVLSCGSGFESQNSLELVFGLGADSEARVSVRWPGRAVEDFGVVKAGGRYLLVENAAQPATYPAQTFRFKDPAPRGFRLAIGDRLERLALRELDGSAKEVSVTGEKPVLLNFWATTCASCVAELPLLGKLHGEGKYRVVAVSLDPTESTPAIEKLRAKLSLPFPIYLISDKKAGGLLDLQRMGIPLSVLLSPDGRVLRVLQGRLREGEL
jgi:thiol-disulfide isomerase/thioredoxin